MKGYKKIHPLFVPRLLINLGAGHISMKYGFKVGHLSLFLRGPSRWHYLLEMLSMFSTESRAANESHS